MTMYAPLAVGIRLDRLAVREDQEAEHDEEREGDRHDQRERGEADERARAMRRISSVAYADDERLSDAKTASAVGLPSRWWSSCRSRAAGRAAAS